MRLCQGEARSGLAYLAEVLKGLLRVLAMSPRLDDKVLVVQAGVLVVRKSMEHGEHRCRQQLRLHLRCIAHREWYPRIDADAGPLMTEAAVPGIQALRRVAQSHLRLSSKELAIDFQRGGVVTLATLP